jgi:hypothetical protein
VEGRHEQKHYYGSVRPPVWGSSFGEPITSLRWAYWNRYSAQGKGLLIHMSCQPYTVNLHWTGHDWTDRLTADVQRDSQARLTGTVASNSLSEADRQAGARGDAT